MHCVLKAANRDNASVSVLTVMVIYQRLIFGIRTIRYRKMNVQILGFNQIGRLDVIHQAVLFWLKPDIS